MSFCCIDTIYDEDEVLLALAEQVSHHQGLYSFNESLDLRNKLIKSVYVILF